MIISIAQMDIVLGDKGRNIRKGVSFIEEAVKRKSDIIVFPELWTTGYAKDVKELAEPLNGKTIKKLTETAKEKNIKIFGSIAENHYNTMHYISPKGLEASYRKIHLFSLMNEERFFAAGNKIGLKENIGMMICYDLRFPELSRKLTINGAEILIICAEWPYPRIEHWRTLLKARAIDNLVYVIGCNRVGNDTKFEYFGHSSVIDPWGRRMIEGGKDEALLTCEIDLSLVKEVRKKFPVLKDIKEIY
jgi:predicted amidohydrolase